MPVTIEVRFKGNRKDYFLWPEDGEGLYRQVPVIVEAERGHDFGRVGVVGETAEKKCAAGCSGCAVGGSVPTASRPIVRIASQDDIRTANELRRSEEDTRFRAVERVRHHNLEMKLSDAEWQWDRKKLTFYFTAEKRVDFRDLVRDLASTFKTRIELRQIGVRDEAARLGGVGRCGKEYCCSTWLRELDPISLGLAKDQHLSLNPAQISGGCGRLLCCLKYEHEFYVASRKRFPKEGKTIRTAVGAEKVVAVDIFRERVFLRSEEHGARFVLLADLNEEITNLPEAGTVTAPPPREAPPPRTERSRERDRPERAPDSAQRSPDRGDRSRDRIERRPDRPERDVSRPEGTRDRPERRGERPDRSDRRRERAEPGRDRPERTPSRAEPPPSAPQGGMPAPPAAGTPAGDGPTSPAGDPQRRRKRRRRRGRKGGGPGTNDGSPPASSEP
ncbi:MAG: regulatory iron-sulfur-containing complex subunit RicT [Gemmatimonadales bacterium]